MATTDSHTETTWVSGASMARPGRHHHDRPDGRLTHSHLDGKYPHDADHRWTFEQVAELGNDPDVAFDGTDVFRLTTLPVPADGTVATLQSYRDQGDDRFADAVEDMVGLYRQGGPTALPPVVADADGWVEDGAHRLCAAFELGWTELPAFVLWDCNTCGATGRWESTLEDTPDELVDLGVCPDC